MSEEVNYRARSIEASTRLAKAGFKSGAMLGALELALAELEAYRDATRGLMSKGAEPAELKAFMEIVTSRGEFDEQRAVDFAIAAIRAGKDIGLAVLSSIVSARVLTQALEGEEGDRG